jgi:hypothetical protein
MKTGTGAEINTVVSPPQTEFNNSRHRKHVRSNKKKLEKKVNAVPVDEVLVVDILNPADHLVRQHEDSLHREPPVATATQH